MSELTFISVIIPTYQRCSMVEQALKVLCNQTYSPDRFEVIVSVDGSRDGTREMVEAFKAPYSLRCLYQFNRGRAAACNSGIAAAIGDLVILLDDDMKPAPDFLSAHFQAHLDNPRLGVMGAVPIYYGQNSRPVIKYIGNKFNRHLENLARPDYNFSLRSFYSGNFSIPKNVLLEVGSYDEDFKVYGNEDLDLFLRLKKAGVQFKFSPQALAYQSYTKDFRSLARDNISKGQTAVLLATKHPETFKDLKLSAYYQVSYRWRFLRGWLLGLSSLFTKLPDLIIKLINLFEKRPGLNMDPYYSLALDYFYWLGVRKALDQPVRGSRALKLKISKSGKPNSLTQTIVYYTDSTGFGGAEQALLHLLAGLNPNCWKPVLFYHHSPGIAPLLEGAKALGVELKAVPALPLGKEGALHIPQFYRAIHAERPTIFHAYLTWPLACKFGLMAAILARVPAIIATYQLYVEAPYSRFARLQQRLLSLGIDRLIVVSVEVERRLTQVFHFPPRKFSLVYNSSSDQSFVRPPDLLLRTALTGGTARQIVLVVARLDEQKGHTYLLQAATRIDEAIFVLAGDGPLRSKLELQAQELNISDRVVFLGYRDDIAELLASCDLFVLPSLYEGLPLSILEAMAVGKPVIATAIGGTDEVVIDGETGILVPPANPAMLAEAIKTLLADPRLAQQLGQAGADRVHQTFTSEIMVKHITQIYRELLGIAADEDVNEAGECYGKR